MCRPNPERAVFRSFAVSRLRIATDGEGVTTLVTGYGCPLRCRYCLNPQSWREGTAVKSYTPEELYEKLRIDDLYFVATGGGVTFGGGEPLLYAPFLEAFGTLCAGRWKISVETSLQVPQDMVERLTDTVSLWIVDIKDTDPEIYRAYTGGDVGVAMRNLRYLAAHVDPERIRVRLPRIPGYNTDADVEKSRQMLAEIGIRNFDPFTYRTDIDK